MLGQHILKVSALELLDDLIILKAADLHHLGAQGLGHNIHFAVVRLYQHIALPGVNSDGQVARQGPDGGGPDHKVHFGQIAVLTELAQIVPVSSLGHQYTGFRPL